MVLTSLEVIFQENLFMETFKDKKPEDIIECWVVSFNNGDLKAILDLYNNESVLMPTFLPDILTNKNQIKNYFERVIKSNVGVELDHTKIIIKEISKNNYVITGPYIFINKKDKNIKHHSRFTFLVDMLSSSPIRHHHSSKEVSKSESI